MLVVVAGEDDDRGFRLPPQPEEHLEPAQVGKSEVEQHEIGDSGTHGRQGTLAVASECGMRAPFGRAQHYDADWLPVRCALCCPGWRR